MSWPGVDQQYITFLQCIGSLPALLRGHWIATRIQNGLAAYRTRTSFERAVYQTGMKRTKIPRCMHGCRRNRRKEKMKVSYVTETWKGAARRTMAILRTVLRRRPPAVFTTTLIRLRTRISGCSICKFRVWCTRYAPRHSKTATTRYRCVQCSGWRDNLQNSASSFLTSSRRPCANLLWCCPTML